MWWNIAYRAALVLGVISGTGRAFVSRPQPIKTKCCRRRQQQTRSPPAIGASILTDVDNWDNDDFLSSLSSGSGDDDDDGISDDASSSGVAGAELTDEMKEKMKANNEPDGSQGGSRFKQLMEKARSAGGGGSSNPSAGSSMAASARNLQEQVQQLMNAPPQSQQSQPQQPQQQQPNMQASFEQLSVQQQAELFRQMMANQQLQPPQPPQQQQAPAGNHLPPGMAADGRKIGRNRDADAIQNTSDLYFAQLKRDSSLRNIARQRGDTATSEAVFQDESIEKLKDLMYDNPYLIEQQREEKEEFENQKNEYIEFRKAEIAKEQVDKTSSGVSYKQKVEERRRQKAQQQEQQQSNQGLTPPPQPPPAAVPQTTIEETLPPPPPPPPAAPVAHETPVAAAVAQHLPPPLPPPVVESPPQQQQQQEPQQQEDDENRRQEVRTLMGLLLKHRGGEGFGSGRLNRQEEIDRFEQLLGDVTNTLKQEAMAGGGGVANNNDDDNLQLQLGATTAPSTTIFVSPPPPPPPPPPVVTPTPATEAAPAPQPLQTVVASETDSGGRVPAQPTTEEHIESVVSCLEGAIQMYRNAPPELRGGLLVALRETLLSAINTCSKFIAEHEQQNYLRHQQMHGGDNNDINSSNAPRSPTTEEHIESVLSCLEGAIQMYRNAPPELRRGGLLLTLRETLLSAINTCNKFIAEHEQQNYSRYQQM